MKQLRTIMLSIVGLGLVASTASAEPVVLKFADQNAENSWGSVHATQPWIKQLEQASGNTVKVELYANQSLAKGSQSWMAVKNGIADISWNAMAVYPGMNPLAEVITLPGLPYTDPMQASAALWTLFEKYPALSQPYADNKVLALYTSDMFNLVSTKPIRTLEDLKGKKIRTVAGPLVDALKALGAVPVVIPMPDVYLGLQRGTIDGALASWEPYNGFRFYEVAKYVITNAPFGFSFFSIAMNKKQFDALPDQAKTALEAQSGLAGSVWFAEKFSFSSRSVLQTLRDKGVEINTLELSPEERVRWIERGATPIWETWVTSAEKKGFTDAQAILDEALGTAK